MIKKEHKILGAKVLQLGITFKENCPDIRNSHAVDVVRGLNEFGCNVDIFDPWAAPEEIQREYGLAACRTFESLQSGTYDAVVLAVAHREFATLEIKQFGRENAVYFDIKGQLPKEQVDGRL